MVPKGQMCHYKGKLCRLRRSKKGEKLSSHPVGPAHLKLRSTFVMHLEI